MFERAARDSPSFTSATATRGAIRPNIRATLKIPIVTSSRVPSKARKNLPAMGSTAALEPL